MRYEEGTRERERERLYRGTVQIGIGGIRDARCMQRERERERERKRERKHTTSMTRRRNNENNGHTSRNKHASCKAHA